jgi:imidazolonepropionase-like amidohydrolase
LRIHALRHVFLAAVMASALGIAAPASAQEAQVTAFVNVNVVPMDSERVLAGQTVVIEGETIVAVGPTADVAVPAGAEVIDGNGMFLAPGLADMHMHLSMDPSPDFMRLFLAAGTTTIRNLNTLPEHQIWQADVLQGKRIGPTIYNSGPVIVGPPDVTIVWMFWALVIGGFLGVGLLLWLALWLARRLAGDRIGARKLRKRLLPGAVIVLALGVIVIWSKVIPINAFTSSQFPVAYVPDTVERAQAEVLRQAAAGYDLIKIYDYLDRDLYLAALSAARSQGIYAIGHIDHGFENAFAAGLRESAHVDEFIDDHLLEPMSTRDFKPVEFDMERIPESVAKIAAFDIMVVSNMTTDENTLLFLEAGPDYFRRPEYAVIRPSTIDEWLGSRMVNWQPTKAWRRQDVRPFLMELTKALHAAGVPLLTGTDVSVDGSLPSHIHDDLALLVEAGLSPFEALKAATANAGISVNRMGSPDVFGEVAVGQRADLILLEASPLEDISATRQRTGLMTRGHWYTQAELDALVAELVATY